MVSFSRTHYRIFCFVLCVLRPSIYFICIGLAVNFCGMYGDRRRVGLPTSRARARVRRLTPTDRYPRDSNPGPLDLKSSILPLSYRPPYHRISHRRFFARGAYRQEGPVGRRGLLASGGGFDPGGLPLATPLCRISIDCLTPAWRLRRSASV